MTISFNGESAVLSNTNFSRRDFDAAVRDNRYHHSSLPDRSSTAAKDYDTAIRRLQRLQANLRPGNLSDQDRTSIRDAVRGVRDARLATQRANVANPDRATTPPNNTPQTQQPPRDPRQGLVQNPGEQGIWRDPGSGEIRHREDGARTQLERADQNERYQQSGRQQYRQGPTTDQVNTGGRVFREGDKGAGVKRLQEALRNAGYNVGRKGADGFYGPDTAKAVQEFLRHQNNHSGTVGHAELARLLNISLPNI